MLLKCAATSSCSATYIILRKKAKKVSKQSKIADYFNKNVYLAQAYPQYLHMKCSTEPSRLSKLYSMLCGPLGASSKSLRSPSASSGARNNPHRRASSSHTSCSRPMEYLSRALLSRTSWLHLFYRGTPLCVHTHTATH